MNALPPLPRAGEGWGEGIGRLNIAVCLRAPYALTPTLSQRERA